MSERGMEGGQVSQEAEPWKQGGLGAVPAERHHSTLPGSLTGPQVSPPPLPQAPCLGTEGEAPPGRAGGGMVGNKTLSQIGNSCVSQEHNPHGGKVPKTD